ncbi:hypothetical protein TNCV_3961821 [Trichonephila clavipes]|nr:hypothetical protein TNCV_3961821 [Trichonephila clavipes]
MSQEKHLYILQNTLTDLSIVLSDFIRQIPNLHCHVLLLELIGKNCHSGPKEPQENINGNRDDSPSQTDEAHFWLNGYVNKQNCRLWSEANPQVYVETPLHPEKLTVWCALWAGGILLQKRRRPQRYSQW